MSRKAFSDKEDRQYYVTANIEFTTTLLCNKDDTKEHDLSVIEDMIERGVYPKILCISDINIERE